MTGDLETGEPPERSTIPNLTNRLKPAITAGRPFFLDFPWMSSAAQVLVGPTGKRQPVNAVEHVYRGCRESGLSFIPVVGPHRDPARVGLVRDALRMDGRGVSALRHSPVGETPRQELYALLVLELWLRRLRDGAGDGRCLPIS